MNRENRDYTDYLDVVMPPDPRRDVVWKEIVGYMQRFVPEDSSVLDVGAGHCHFINNIRCAGKVALDMHPAVEGHAAPGVRVVLGDCTRMGEILGGERFDVVFASHVLEHLDRDGIHAFLDQARATLKPEGRLMLLQPNYRYCSREYFDDWTHVTPLDHDSLHHVLRLHGFVVSHLEPRLLPYSMASRLPTWGLLVRIYLRLPVRPLAKQMFCVATLRPWPQTGPEGDRRITAWSDI